MKKVILSLLTAAILSIAPVISASIGNSNKIYEEVKDGYSVGYTIDRSTILGNDMHMWNFEGVIPGWYVAYNIEEDSYYYITQDAAQEFLEIKR